MCIRDRAKVSPYECGIVDQTEPPERFPVRFYLIAMIFIVSVSYTHLRAHETVLDLVCRLLLEKKKHNH